jgi:hypothetical protein
MNEWMALGPLGTLAAARISPLRPFFFFFASMIEIFQWTAPPFKNVYRVSTCYDGDQIEENGMAGISMDLF